jgi:hypothetical protein
VHKSYGRRVACLVLEVEKERVALSHSGGKERERESGEERRGDMKRGAVR